MVGIGELGIASSYNSKALKRKEHSHLFYSTSKPTRHNCCSRLGEEMQRFRTLSTATRCSLNSLCSLSQLEDFSAQPDYIPAIKDLQSQVLVDGKAISRTAILNRPSNLNAFHTSMVARLKKLYESWEENNDIGFVMMKGSGRAFSAGGDVVTIYQLMNEGKVEECKEFFGTVYKFIYLLATYLKPNEPLKRFLTMHVCMHVELGCCASKILLGGYLGWCYYGGGARISIPGMFRVATDKTVFATPETQIGFHPDAGASLYLSRLPGYLGEYLALTEEKLNGVEMIASGLATHYCLNARLALIKDRLGKLITDDASIIESSLEQYGDLVFPEKREAHFIGISSLNKDTVEEIVDALEDEATNSYDDWCASVLKKLKEASPLSLKLSLRSIREGKFQSLDQCLAREYRMTVRGISKHVSYDFCEGVRARLVDKDYAPKWDPPSLSEVSKDMVDYYFAPFSELEPELDLPTATREPFV